MKHARAFTLIELMIVVVVIAILAAIAIPNYQSHVRKSRRQEAIASLIEIQLIEERYRTNNSSYTNDTSTLSSANGGQFPSSTYYNFSVTNASSTTYTINAIAKTGQSQAQDAGCTTLTINQDSNKTPTDCW